MAEGKVTAFRLEPSVRARLEREAKRLGMPPGTLARRLVEEGLDREGALRPELDHLQRDVRELNLQLATTTQELLAQKRNLWNSVLALLVRDKPFTRAEANKWAKEHLSD